MRKFIEFVFDLFRGTEWILGAGGWFLAGFMLAILVFGMVSPKTAPSQPKCTQSISVHFLLRSSTNFVEGTTQFTEITVNQWRGDIAPSQLLGTHPFAVAIDPTAPPEDATVPLGGGIVFQALGYGIPQCA